MFESSLFDVSGTTCVSRPSLGNREWVPCLVHYRLRRRGSVLPVTETLTGSFASVVLTKDFKVPTFRVYGVRPSFCLLARMPRSHGSPKDLNLPRLGPSSSPTHTPVSTASTNDVPTPFPDSPAVPSGPASHRRVTKGRSDVGGRGCRPGSTLKGRALPAPSKGSGSPTPLVVGRRPPGLHPCVEFPLPSSVTDTPLTGTPGSKPRVPPGF